MEGMFRNLGNILPEIFQEYQQKNSTRIPAIWKETYKILGNRIKFMIYENYEYCYNGWPNVVECLIGAKSTIGVEIAEKLSLLISNYNTNDEKIYIKDVVNPLAIPNIRFESTNTGNKLICPTDMYIFEDERFLAVMRKKGKKILLYFYKKN